MVEPRTDRAAEELKCSEGRRLRLAFRPRRPFHPIDKIDKLSPEH